MGSGSQRSGQPDNAAANAASQSANAAADAPRKDEITSICFNYIDN
jgi:hypothetical protein